MKPLSWDELNKLAFPLPKDCREIDSLPPLIQKEFDDGRMDWNSEDVIDSPLLTADKRRHEVEAAFNHHAWIQSWEFMVAAIHCKKGSSLQGVAMCHVRVPNVGYVVYKLPEVMLAKAAEQALWQYIQKNKLQLPKE